VIETLAATETAGPVSGPVPGVAPPAGRQTRIGNRRPVQVAGRLTWRDASGTQRFAPVLTRDASDVDVYVECQMPASIPLYRLVYLQLEVAARNTISLPPALRQGKVLSAIYRVGPYRSATGTPQGYALRLLVEPRVAAVRTPQADVTAMR